ncbi:hypothetical protein F2Q68_00008969 [Brassica cretica]|uniref:Uncharacterized protein n=1 Tax=Brassica cretica TaxID=69181 RepID=A0A8S9KUH1_BRACR|nr:hypothetical protein F2Q68_00008969 [Brassica cretica]
MYLDLRSDQGDSSANVQSEPSGSFAVRSRTVLARPGQSVGSRTDHTGRLIHQYVRRDTRLGSGGPKGRDYGLSRFPLDQSEFWLDHQSWLGELVREDVLRYGRFGHLDVVPALAHFRLLAGRSGTRLGLSVWNDRLLEPQLE